MEIYSNFMANVRIVWDTIKKYIELNHSKITKFYAYDCITFNRRASIFEIDQKLWCNSSCI